MKVPIVLNIHDDVVIFGGGKVALRKIEYLSNFTKNITVVTKDALPMPKHVKLITTSLNIKNISKFIPKNTSLVISALSDSSLNQAIAQWCFRHKILVNVVDNLELSTILFPALSTKKDLSIAVSTSGKCPFLAKKIREEIDLYIEEKVHWLEILGPLRKKLVGVKTKDRVLSAVYENPDIRRLVQKGDIKKAEKKAEEVLRVHSKH